MATFRRCVSLMTIAHLSVSHAQYNPTSVAEAWSNHFNSFGANNVTGIMLDYTANSIVEIWDQAAGTFSSHTGTTAIEAMFTSLFEDLGSPNPATVPVDNMNPVVEEPSSNAPFGHVFLLWETPLSTHAHVTDTFIFDETNFRIVRQNIVIFPTGSSDDCPVAAADQDSVTAAAASLQQVAWENHFSAFGSQDISQIMIDYKTYSEIRVYDFLTSASTPAIDLYDSPGEIQDFFTALFADLAIMCDLSVPLVHTTTFDSLGDASGTGLGQTLLIWRSPSDRYAYVTDTFVYDSYGGIVKQNIVAMKKAPCACNCTCSVGNTNGASGYSRLAVAFVLFEALVGYFCTTL